VFDKLGVKSAAELAHLLHDMGADPRPLVRENPLPE
jgi:hypothetical protein